MSRYRRSHVEDATFFFTANLANRNSQLLVDEYERLWCAIDTARARHPFHTLAYYVQPDHVHVIWKMPGGDADFSLRWSVIKRLFSSGLPASTVSQCKAAKREKAFCKDAFGNTRFVTLPIYSSTWITSITTPLNMGLPRLFTNGGTRRSTCICRTGGCQRIGVTNWMPMFPNEVSAYDGHVGTLRFAHRACYGVRICF
jgi:REP element-mobilizing transposase RayT